MLIDDRYKVLYFFGYEELGEGVERIELYDLVADREELHNLFPERRTGPPAAGDPEGKAGRSERTLPVRSYSRLRMRS